MDPGALKARVVVDRKLLYYRTVFIHLTDSRQFSKIGTPMPIPISEYNAYFEMFKIDSLTERERIFRYVRAQDRVFIEVQTAKVKAEMDKHTKRAVAQ